MFKVFSVFRLTFLGTRGIYVFKLVLLPLIRFNNLQKMLISFCLGRVSSNYLF